MKENNKEIRTLNASYVKRYGTKLSVKTEDRLLAYVAAAATIAGGVLHLMMIGPFLKPPNFPMQLLPYTDTLFIVAGLAQIFWALPMIKGWGLRWYYFGILGTAALSMLLILTRLPNGITSTALHDTNPMALLTEMFQFVYIGATIIIARKTYLRQAGKIPLLRLYGRCKWHLQEPSFFILYCGWRGVSTKSELHEHQPATIMPSSIAATGNIPTRLQEST